MVADEPNDNLRQGRMTDCVRGEESRLSDARRELPFVFGATSGTRI